MILGLGFGGALGALGMMLHMTFHSITKPLLFFCAGNVEQHLKTDLFRRVKGGMIHSMPVTGPIFLMARWQSPARRHSACSKASS